MSRDREHDKWIPWYVDDTPAWRKLSLSARGAMEGIARKLNDKTGKLYLRRGGLPSLAELLGCRWEELEPAIGELFGQHRVEWDGSTFCLSDPEYLERRRRTSADRMRAKRQRDACDACDACDASDVTPVTPVTVTPVTAVLVSSSLVSSGSDLSLGSDPPSWWGSTLETIEANTGVKLPAGEAWLRYSGHRSTKSLPCTAQDAGYWLASVMVREARADRDERAHREQRDKDFDAARREKKVDYTPKYEQPTREQSKAMAEEFARRVRELGPQPRKVGT